MDDLERLEQYESVWQRLQREKRPIALYGMGDGADKILKVFAAYQIQVSAVFASDEFVRGHSFHGFPVQTLRETEKMLGSDMVIVIAFASQRPQILQRMDELDARYDVYAPDVPVAGDSLFTPSFVCAHADALRAAYTLLADEVSRAVYKNIIAYKLTGRLRFLRACTTDKQEAFLSLLCPHETEDFVDLGAYNGDTIRELLSYTGGKYASVTALEPDRKNRKKLQKYVQETLDKRVSIVPAGAWDQDGVQCFAAKAGRNSILSDKGTEIAVRSVDSVLRGAPCTMLKADVEGAEQRALQGARQTIAAYRPRLNIAAYHRSEDLFALPLQIHALCPAYKIYLRHHPYVPAWDTNLYARIE